VGSGPAIEQVGAIGAVQPVVAATPLQVVVSSEPEETVADVIADERVAPSSPKSSSIPTRRSFPCPVAWAVFRSATTASAPNQRTESRPGPPRNISSERPASSKKWSTPGPPRWTSSPLPPFR
jgi:hypothetical protein